MYTQSELARFSRMNTRLAESIKVLKVSGGLDNLSKEKNKKLVEWSC